MKKVAIIGAAGYVARELIALLATHPFVTVNQCVSDSQKGKPVGAFHRIFHLSETLVFSGEWDSSASDMVFLCGGHGASRQFFERYQPSEAIAVIDLSMDFRTDDSFVYGLPEVHRGIVSNRIANPGCFATALQLAILPLLGKSHSPWHIHALTGSSGAGQALQTSTQFSWRANNISTYKVFEHQHLIEITHHGVKNCENQGRETFPALHFVPLRGDFVRGIFATAYCETTLSQAEVRVLYAKYYEQASFTKVLSEPLDLKQVVGTNFCLLHPQVVDGKVFVTSIIDNLLKGAAGQAVENMNAFFGFEPTSGLLLKPTFL